MNNYNNGLVSETMDNGSNYNSYGYNSKPNQANLGIFKTIKKISTITLILYFVWILVAIVTAIVATVVVDSLNKQIINAALGTDYSDPNSCY